MGLDDTTSIDADEIAMLRSRLKELEKVVQEVVDCDDAYQLNDGEMYPNYLPKAVEQLRGVLGEQPVNPTDNPPIFDPADELHYDRIKASARAMVTQHKPYDGINYQGYPDYLDNAISDLRDALGE